MTTRLITRHYALIPGLLLTLGGCMTNATVELTKAPFDATTQLTNGTSGATKEFLDPTTEFTSSTTPGALADGRLLRAKQKATVFAMMIGSYPTLFDQQLSLSQSNERVIDLAWANGYGMPQPAVK